MLKDEIIISLILKVVKPILHNYIFSVRDQNLKHVNPWASENAMHIRILEKSRLWYHHLQNKNLGMALSFTGVWIETNICKKMC